MINYLRKYAQNMIKYLIIHYISCIIGQNYPKKNITKSPKISRKFPAYCYIDAIDIHIFIWYYPANDYEA